MSKERISYLDVAKGLLILSVVVHHIPHTAELAGIDLFPYFNAYNYIIVPFFMPAFFVITGWCTNFNKPFVPYLIGNVKTLLIPAFVLGAVSNWIRLAADCCIVPLEYMKLGFRTIITDGGPYWFLSALFVAKILYWLMNKFLRHVAMRVIAQVACLFLGIILYNGGVIFGISNTL